MVFFRVVAPTNHPLYFSLVKTGGRGVLLLKPLLVLHCLPKVKIEVGSGKYPLHLALGSRDTCHHLKTVRHFEWTEGSISVLTHVDNVVLLLRELRNSGCVVC